MCPGVSLFGIILFGTLHSRLFCLFKSSAEGNFSVIIFSNRFSSSCSLSSSHTPRWECLYTWNCPRVSLHQLYLTFLAPGTSFSMGGGGCRRWSSGGGGAGGRAQASFAHSRVPNRPWTSTSSRPRGWGALPYTIFIFLNSFFFLSFWLDVLASFYSKSLIWFSVSSTLLLINLHLLHWSLLYSNEFYFTS